MDGGAASRIAALAIGDGSLPIIEVGPGTGALTKAMLALGVKPLLIEIDPDMISIMRADQLYADLDIIQADALEYPYENTAERGEWIACGNLPYNIGTPLLMKWIEAEFPPTRIVVMLQRDVADRLMAQASTAAYGSLSVTTQLTMNVRRAFSLGPSVFYPRPKVDSAVVLLERREEPAVPKEFLAITRDIARAAFAYRRKTLANSLMLARGYSRQHINETLEALGFDANIRGENLTLSQFGLLARQLGPVQSTPE